MSHNSFLSADEIAQLGLKSFGSEVKISRYARFYNSGEISLGDNVRIDDFCILSGKITIGSTVHISAFCAFYGAAGITIDSYSGTSPRCTIFSASDDFSGSFLAGAQFPVEMRKLTEGMVRIGRYVQVGAGCIILPGVSIGEGTAVGAMSLVNVSLPSWGIYAGIPAVFKKGRSSEMLNLLSSK